MKTIALIGNPNCGKTTLFNALTGSRQRVGNWPGVTVERKSGSFTSEGTQVEVVDLPGIYDINPNAFGAIDERIACHFILGNEAKLIINIVDASNLERHLYLTTQLIEMNAPMILALNMMDIAQHKGIRIDTKKLAAALGVPVIALTSNKKMGINELKSAIVQFAEHHNRTTIPYPKPLQNAIENLQSSTVNQWQAIRLLEGDNAEIEPNLLAKVQYERNQIKENLHEDADILLADSRYRFIESILKQCVRQKKSNKNSWTTRIDNIVLHRFLGIPIFLVVMYLLFLFAINIGGAFQDFFDQSSQTIFVSGFAYLLTQIHTPTWLVALLANGIGKGINTTITFIPVIGAMFLFLALLEDSGYMARAAFIIDRFMRTLGLPGKAFIPMIVGFGCNVPAVMAARTLENKRDRILTIMMSPFMSCGARLAIFAVFTTAFFPSGGQNIVFALYLIGIVMAVLTGFILRQTLLRGDPAPLMMELPLYHIPQTKTLLLHAWQRLRNFVFRAGKLIIPICVLLGALNTLNLDGSLNSGEGDANSILSMMGKWMTPLFAPMGIHTDNWPATVGLVTGILAKEVVVGTLNTLYTQMGQFNLMGGEGFHFWANLQGAWQSIPDNFAQLGSAFINPVLAKAPIHAVNEGVYGVMVQKFDGAIGAFAYLLFVLLYFPCVSTTAVMLRELHRGWSIFSILWMTGIAYGTAVLFYQGATWTLHPLASSLWIGGILGAFWMTVVGIRWMGWEKTGTINLEAG